VASFRIAGFGGCAAADSPRWDSEAGEHNRGPFQSGIGALPPSAVVAAVGGVTQALLRRTGRLALPPHVITLFALALPRLRGGQRSARPIHVTIRVAGKIWKLGEGVDILGGF
jgi:hypothetical protein